MSAELDEMTVAQIELFKKYVAQPFPTSDPGPSLVGKDLFVGNKYHAADVSQLTSLGIVAVLNCAPMGIRSLPLDQYEACGIQYFSTNCKRDDSDYPILRSKDGQQSEHLDHAATLYGKIQQEGGKVMFCCVAGQNRSSTLAVATLLLNGEKLEPILERCSQCRPFILENVGFQKQLVELQSRLQENNGLQCPRKSVLSCGSIEDIEVKDDEVAAQVVVPGLSEVLCLPIPAKATIAKVKQIIVDETSKYLAPNAIGLSWLIFHGGCTAEGPIQTLSDVVLEDAALDLKLQLERLQNAFGLWVDKGSHGAAVPSWSECQVSWNLKPFFELIIFSTNKQMPGGEAVEEPFTFRHVERHGAPSTLLMSNLIDTHLRSWDFESAEGFRTVNPCVFSYSSNPRQKRDFADLSCGNNDELRKFESPGSSLLGMGANAIVHRVQLSKAELMDLPMARPRADIGEMGHSGKKFPQRQLFKRSQSDLPPDYVAWDAAVKRSFGLMKMLAALQKRSEAGVAKRLRMAHALNRNERVLHFYGLAVALASDEADRSQYHFEVSLLSQFDSDFSTYTLKSFLEDYATDIKRAASMNIIDEEKASTLAWLQNGFSLIKVKVLIVSLLNGFRDLTLMGVKSFDFNHFDNVLISRNFRKARLIDIDGREACEGAYDLHKPALDIDLFTLLPVFVSRLMLGKGRGLSFVDQTISQIKQTATRSEDEAKEILKQVIVENFFSQDTDDGGSSQHVSDVTQWYYALLMKQEPWTNWTNDIYDAMRCFDHLPIC